MEEARVDLTQPLDREDTRAVVRFIAEALNPSLWAGFAASLGDEELRSQKDRSLGLQKAWGEPSIDRVDRCGGRGASVALRDLAEAAPQVEETEPEYYREEIAPHLSDFSVDQIVEATGLSKPYCNKIRCGQRLPRPRHWPGLEQLIGTPSA